MSEQTFRKKPVVIQAVRWTGDNEAKLVKFAGDSFGTVPPEDWRDDPDITAQIFDKLHSTWVGVKTGQWIIRGIKGEFYPCDDEAFRETYEPADGARASDEVERLRDMYRSLAERTAEKHLQLTADLDRYRAVVETVRAVLLWWQTEDPHHPIEAGDLMTAFEDALSAAETTEGADA
jgi:hypothetical protein